MAPLSVERLTDNHHIEVEALANTLAVPLVGQIGKSHVSRQLPPYDISHVTGRSRRCFGVFRAHRLGGNLSIGAHWVGSLAVGRGRLAVGYSRRGWVGRCSSRCIC